ncbi:MAG TPA: choice-of-anchor Q domain-containing protein, partial [Anaerolineae bacterium]|nr:choice-of-anchor Q domain-containing protein [Anaerolineae bacterium]
LNSNHIGGDGGAGYANGGAYFSVYGQVQATSNLADGNGGAFYLAGGSRLVVDDDYLNTRPQIWVNQAANGGAVYASSSSRIDCLGADFGGSSNGNSATSGSGGAIYLSGGALAADNCTFRNNQAQAGDGGAIAAYTATVMIDADYSTALLSPIGSAERSGPSAPQATVCDPLATQCSSFSNNRAISSTVNNGNGGAIYSYASALHVNNTYLQRNRAVRGGAIYQENATARSWLSNTLIYSNTSLLQVGAGIRNDNGVLTLTQVTVANNVGGAGLSGGGTANYVYNTIIWGNGNTSTPPIGGSGCNIDQAGHFGVNTNPLFSGAGAAENYHLGVGSPAIDACASGLPRDLDNVARPFGPQFDMGAYEWRIYRLNLPIILRN